MILYQDQKAKENIKGVLQPNNLVNRKISLDEVEGMLKNVEISGISEILWNLWIYTVRGGLHDLSLQARGV